MTIALVEFGWATWVASWLKLAGSWDVEVREVMTVSTVVRIGKRFRFEAAHFLPGLPEGHPCARLHGHSYTVEVVLVGAKEGLVAPGFVVDFGELAPLTRYLDEEFDHRTLNEVVAFPPTSELLACHLLEWCCARLLPRLPARPAIQKVLVRVWETESCWAEAEREVAAA